MIANFVSVLYKIQSDKVKYDNLMQYLSDVQNPQYMCIYNILTLKCDTMELYEEIDAFIRFQYEQGASSINGNEIDQTMQLSHILRCLTHYYEHNEYPLILEDAFYVKC